MKIRFNLTIKGLIFYVQSGRFKLSTREALGSIILAIFNVDYGPTFE